MIGRRRKALFVVLALMIGLAAHWLRDPDGASLPFRCEWHPTSKGCLFGFPWPKAEP